MSVVRRGEKQPDRQHRGLALPIVIASGNAGLAAASVTWFDDADPECHGKSAVTFGPKTKKMSWLILRADYRERLNLGWKGRIRRIR